MANTFDGQSGSVSILRDDVVGGTIIAGVVRTRVTINAAWLAAHTLPNGTLDGPPPDDMQLIEWQLQAQITVPSARPRRLWPTARKNLGVVASMTMADLKALP